MKGKYIKTIVLPDPDTGMDVHVSIYKLANGGMVGIDESFLENTDEGVYSPFEYGVELYLD